MITEEIVNFFKNKKILDETINEKAMNSQLSILPFLSSSSILLSSFLEWLRISNTKQICDEITKIKKKK